MALGLGTWEFVVVGLALLIFFGPEHAPRAVRTLGRWQRKIRHTLSEIEQTLDEEAREMEETMETTMEGFDPTAPPPEAETWSFSDPAQPADQEGQGDASGTSDDEAEGS